MNIRVSPPFGIVTAADLIRHFGDIPAERIRLQPVPGTATVADVIAVEANEHRLCELVDGVLVEKAMGAYESRFAAVLIFYLEQFVFVKDLGVVCGEAATLRIMPNLVRIPDVCFISWARLPDRVFPADPVPDLVPDLAVEVLSKSNTSKEMSRKLGEYFEAGVRQVWFVDLNLRQIRVYTNVNQSRLYKEGDTVRGGTVLPGFTLTVKALFNRAGVRR
jgi:Uma2 family endonuclease